MSKILTLKPKEEKELLKDAKGTNGEKKRIATRLLLYYNQNLVKYIVRGYSSFGGKIDYEDLIAEGNISLLKAIEKFDLNSKNRFATYAGYWIRQYIQSFINKNQLINQGPTVKERKNVVYYDSTFQSDDKENKSYSLMDTLDDSENSEMAADQIRQKDTIIQVNRLINSLDDREKIIFTRLWNHDKKHSKIIPSNLFDVYCMCTDEEKKELLKKKKVDKDNPSALEGFSLEEKNNRALMISKKYLSLFDKNYKFSELSKVFSKPENYIKKLKADSFNDLQKLAKKRKLYYLDE